MLKKQTEQLTNLKNMEESKKDLVDLHKSDKKMWLILTLISSSIFILNVCFFDNIFKFPKPYIKIIIAFLVFYLTIKFYLNYLHFKWTEGNRVENDSIFGSIYVFKKGKINLSPFDLIFNAKAFNFNNLTALNFVGQGFLKPEIRPLPSWFIHTPKNISSLGLTNINLNSENGRELAQKYSNIESLYMKNCKFKDLHNFLDCDPKPTLGHVPTKIYNLKNIDIENCEISNDYWKASEKLYTVTMKNCSLNSIPKGVSLSKSCYKGDFSNNDITFISLENCSINKLFLSRNKILTNDISSLPTRLDEIDLSNNPLTEFPEILLKCESLRYINLSNCEIENIGDNTIIAIQKKWQIKSINLKGNKLNTATKTRLYQLVPQIVEIE